MTTVAGRTTVVSLTVVTDYPSDADHAQDRMAVCQRELLRLGVDANLSIAHPSDEDDPDEVRP